MAAPTLPHPRRESVATIRTDGSRAFLFPADARGRFARARRLTAFALIAFYLSLPWVRINGYPAVLLDVATQRFHLFGLTLAAQDLWLMFFLITGLGFSLFFVTALFGRVWCGWACPQTVFLDHVYRQIERWIDGDAVRRRALRNAPLTVDKFARRVAKHTAYVLVSAVITHLALAYFVSVPEVWAMMRAAPGEHWTAFAFIAIASGALYFNFAWFREQLCIVICPYGRIQSALIDDHSLVIGYDANRGDPPSPGLRRAGPQGLVTGVNSESPSPGLRRAGPENFVTAITSESPSPGLGRTGLGHPAEGLQFGHPKEGLPSVGLAKEGDCVACNRCVNVCPTGIDIRQGLQMECIGCTACIDACDDVMTRLGRPRGLIRYASQASLGGGRTRWVRPRTLLYLGLLLVGAGVATWAFSTVKPAAFAVTRMIGAPYVIDDATVRNQFLVRIVNKRNAPVRFQLAVEAGGRELRSAGFDGVVEVPALGEIVQPLVLQQPRAGYTGPFQFAVNISDAAARVTLTRAAEFLGPEARLLREEEEERRGAK